MEKISGSFDQLTDDQLLSEVKVLVAREREATTALVLSLAEVEGRQLYLAVGYPSLHSYCVHELQLSRAAAYRRIGAARALRAFPAAVEHLAKGSITLTNLNVLAPHLTAENHAAMLDAAQYRTKEEVERQVAELSPGAESLVTLHLRLRMETRDKLRRAQDLLRHAIPDANASDVLDHALTLLIADLERKKLAHVKRPRRPAKIEPVQTRYIEYRLKIRRERGHKFHSPPFAGMREYEACRVQKGTLQPLHGADVIRDTPMDATVRGVADNRVADRAQMYTNLMRAAGGDRDV
jgi:hypothetical protein